MKDDVALRKRTQISKANKMMFLWIAGASVIVGVASVMSIFLFQKLVYTETVLAEKLASAQTMEANVDTLAKLKTDINALEANEALMSSKAKPEDETLRVILDALPSEVNSLALGASLQSKLLGTPELQAAGLTLTGLQVVPVDGIESGVSDGTAIAEGATEVATTSATSAGRINFVAALTGNQDNVYAALTNLERSIRTIVVDSLSITVQDGGVLAASINGHAFYLPEQSLDIIKKTIPFKTGEPAANTAASADGTTPAAEGAAE